MAANPVPVFCCAGLLLAGGLAYLATRTAGPVQVPEFTEQHDFQRGCMHFAPVVAPNLAYAVTRGFAPSPDPLDEQAAAEPAEEMW